MAVPLAALALTLFHPSCAYSTNFQILRPKTGSLITPIRRRAHFTTLQTRVTRKHIRTRVGERVPTRIPQPVDSDEANPMPRQISLVEGTLRLPVWPVVNGLALTVLDLIGLKDLSKSLEDNVGGRVAPVSLDYQRTNPFILMVHHRHSFSPIDPIRPLSSLILPEGFPAHPHRGFETITYVLKGGFIHRDSIGVKMKYWADELSPSVQWLTTGKGLLHEEMWDKDKGKDGFGTSHQELFQIWLNVPKSDKMNLPRVQLLGKGEVQKNLKKDSFGNINPKEIPIVADSPGVSVRVLAGEYNGVSSLVETSTPVTLLHATLSKPNNVWEWRGPSPSHNAFFYVRKGTINIEQTGGVHTEVKAHEMCYLDRGVGQRLRMTATSKDTDILFFAGEVINEPMTSGGSMVMNDDAEIEQAYQDYSVGRFGQPWEHTLKDEEWARLLNNERSR